MGGVGDATVRTQLSQTGQGKGANLVGFALEATGRRDRTVQERLSDLPHLTDFLVGDYHTDNLSARENVLNSGHKSFIVPDGVYRFSDGIDIPCDFRFIGNGAPILGFGTDDDKHFLVDGQKQNMPGASFIFSGTGTKVVTSDNRNDQFSSVRYCVRVLSHPFGAGEIIGASSAVLHGIAVIQTWFVSMLPGRQRSHPQISTLIMSAVFTTMIHHETFRMMFVSSGIFLKLAR